MNKTIFARELLRNLLFRNSEYITPTYFYNYRLMPRHGSPRSHYLLTFHRLFQEFLVVHYKKNGARNLKFLKMNQPSLRAHTYGTLQGQLFTDNFNEGGGECIRGSKVILPSSSVGSPIYMSGKFHDVHPFSSHLLHIPNGLRSLRQFVRLLLQPLQVTGQIL
jgi:hypothetical protein